VSAVGRGPEPTDAAARSGRPGLAGWPVNLLVRDRRVVVIGAGRIAARKIEPLLELGARVVVIAPEIGSEIRGCTSAPSLPTTSTMHGSRSPPRPIRP
jgi:phosphoglycerate dehydrogenase-like enzyme